MQSKKQARLRRAAGTRRKIREIGKPRLCIHRTPRHIYAQIISPDNANILASYSSLNISDVNGGNVAAAKIVGLEIAKRGIEVGVKQVAFDRAGFKYHGRVQELADAAREGGLEF